jgi:hypothetical protein
MQCDFIKPHLICLSEHHMREQEIINHSFNNCRFYREEFSKGGVCILTRNDINFNIVGLNNVSNNETFEICATKLNTKMTNCCTLHIQKLLVVLVILNTLNNFLHRMAYKKFWLMNDQTLNNFQSMLCEETCVEVYSVNNVNKTVNDFQCILIVKCENSFLIIYIGNMPNDNDWILKVLS